MKKILTALILFSTILLTVKVYASQPNDIIWMASDEEFSSFISNRAQTLGDLTFTSGIDKGSSIKMFKGDKLQDFFRTSNYGNTEKGSIKFDVESSCDIYIIGCSSSNGVAREVTIYSTATEQEQSVVVNGPSGYKIEYRGGAGSIYVYTKDMPIRIYGIGVKRYPYTAYSSMSSGFRNYLDYYSDQIPALITSPLEFRDYTILATEDNPVSFESRAVKSKYAISYNKRIKLLGSGTSDYRSIVVHPRSEYELYIAANSSSLTENRELIVTNRYYEDICDNIVVTPEVMTYKVKNITDGDKLYIRSADSGINIYNIEFYKVDEITENDMVWNFSANSQFTLQDINSYKQIDFLSICGRSDVGVSIIDKNISNYTRVLNLSVYPKKTGGYVSFKIPDSRAAARTMAVTAYTQNDDVTLVFANTYGYVYGSELMTKGLKTYRCNYDDVCEEIIIYAFSNQSNASIDICKIATDEKLDVVDGARKTLEIENGKQYTLYFVANSIIPSDYIYSVEYRNAYLDVVSVELTDGTNYYGSNGIDIISNEYGVLKFKTNRNDINWTGLLTTVTFKAKDSRTTSVTFNAKAAN